MELKYSSGLIFGASILVLIVPLWNWNSRPFAWQCEQCEVLIVPLWNWNRVKHLFYDLREMVLIVPLWNWNRLTVGDGFVLLRSNRTFMELKCKYAVNIDVLNKVLIVPLWNWNVKKVAEDIRDNGVLIVPLWNWNYIIRCGNTLICEVLIVPLWNWNKGNGRWLKGRRRSNRTFMELKSGYLLTARLSNRAF